MKPLVSIIMPVYNHQRAFERALASIQAQTYRPLEVIIVDDGSEPPINISGSEDETCSIKLIRQKNAGAPAARNTGLKQSTGEYVIFWDADVEGTPEMIEMLASELEEYPNLSFVYCNHTVHTVGSLPKTMPGKEFHLGSLKQNNYIHSTSLVRRDAVVLWDESLKRFQDWDFFLRIALAGGTGLWIDKTLFSITDEGTMSTWLPRIAYKAPFRWLPGIKSKVEAYEEAKRLVAEKNNIE